MTVVKYFRLYNFSEDKCDKAEEEVVDKEVESRDMDKEESSESDGTDTATIYKNWKDLPEGIQMERYA